MRHGRANGVGSHSPRLCTPRAQGIGFYGLWRSSGAYIACGRAGPECTSCELLGGASDACAGGDGPIVAVPRDAFGRMAYVAPLGIAVRVDGARITEVRVWPAAHRVSLRLARHARAPSATATLWVRAERVWPPPPATAAEYRAVCVPAPGAADDNADALGRCARSGAAPGSAAGEFVVSLGEGDDRVVVLDRG